MQRNWSFPYLLVLVTCLFAYAERGLTFEVYQPSFSSLSFSSEHKNQIIDVADLTGHTDKDVVGLMVDVDSQSDIAISAKILRKIQYLKLLGEGQKISDYLVRQAPQYPQLIHLSVTFTSGNLNEESLSVLAKSCRLQSLLLHSASGPLSPNVYRLAYLEELLVIKMEDGQFPKGISKLPKLKRLMMFKMPKLQLPEDLSQCKKLEVLEILDAPVGNQLFDLLPPNLVALTAFRCELTELAFKKDALHQTRYLSMGENSFKVIPQSMFAHGELEVAMFDFNRTKIEELDFPSIGMEKMKYLSFGGVELGDLSERAIELKKKEILRTGK